MDSVEVSVCVITWRHEDYIAQCLKSIVSQKTNFSFEIIVGVDFSNDRTAEIVLLFADNYPNLIKPIIHCKRVGGNPNYFCVREAAKGGYIACMDGDDLMLPGKLQTQFDFLENNRDCSFVAHKMFSANSDLSLLNSIKPYSDYPTKTTVDYLLLNYLWFAHSSKMYRAVLDENLPSNPIDFEMHVVHAVFGKIGFLNEILGVSRKVNNSITDVKDEKLLDLIRYTLNGYAKAHEFGIAENVVFDGMNRYLFGASIGFAGFNDKVNALWCLNKIRCNNKASTIFIKLVNRKFCPSDNIDYTFLQILYFLRLLKVKLSRRRISKKYQLQWEIFKNYM